MKMGGIIFKPIERINLVGTKTTYQINKGYDVVTKEGEVVDQYKEKGELVFLTKLSDGTLVKLKTENPQTL